MEVVIGFSMLKSLLINTEEDMTCQRADMSNSKKETCRKSKETRKKTEVEEGAKIARCLVKDQG